MASRLYHALELLGTKEIWHASSRKRSPQQQKFAINKTLEQKLIGPMEESHTKEQSPQTVWWMVLWARRSKMAARWARTRAWAGWWFFWEEEEEYGCRNKWRGATWGPRGGGAPSEGGRALDTRGQGLAPHAVFSVPNIIQKNHISFLGHLENFYFWGIFLLHG